MLKIEFDPSNKPLAAAIGAALSQYAGGVELTPGEVKTTATVAETVEESITEEYDEYKIFVGHHAPDSDITAGASSLRRAIGLYEHKAMERDVDPLSFDEIAGALEIAGLCYFTDAKTIFENIMHVTTDVPVNNPKTKVDPPPKKNTDARLDPKGVQFDPDYCSKAAKPFYASGPRKDQWKKRQGIDDGEFDTWYAMQLAGQPVKEDDGQIDTSEAFSSGGTDTIEPPPAGDKDFGGDAGEFMGWVSEQQAAGNLSQPQIDKAYEDNAVQIPDLFNPAKAPDVIKKVYGALSKLVAAGA